MSVGSMEVPELWVEGDDDFHAIAHLLLRHGVELAPGRRVVQIKKTGGKPELLKSMPVAAKASTRRPVGFVLDADTTVEDCWKAVRSALKDSGLAIPAAIPPEGFVGEAAATLARVGVWIMPDNRQGGRLEDFLQELVPVGDPLLPLAIDSTARALSAGAKFPASKRTKANLHCWLAWQDEPGLSYGRAIQKAWLAHDSAVGVAFVSWFRKLYGIASDS